MSKRSKLPRANARPIVAAFTQEDVYLLTQAAKAYAEVLDVTDGLFPNPEQRDAADKLRELAAELRQANSTRDYIEANPA